MATELEVKITADASSAERAVAAFAPKASKYLGGIGAELKSQLVGAFAAGAVISAVRSFGAHIVETVDNVKDLADQLGLGTDEIQRMQKAANDSGVKFSVMASALQRIEAMRAQAASGDKGASGIFASLGIDPSQGTSLDLMLRAMEASGKGQKENAALFDLVGRKANLLKGVVQELKAQGPITLISDSQIKAIDDANLKLEEAKRQLTAQAAGPFAGVLRGMAAQLGALQSPRAFIGGIPGTLATSGFAGLKAAIFGGGSNPAAPGATGPAGGGNQASALTAATPAASAISLGQQGDALSRIGLFVGGRPEVRSLASIERNTADTARAVTRQTKILTSIEDLFKESL